MDTLVVKKGEEARKKILDMIPKGAEVMTASSQTLEAIGVTSEINESGNYYSVKNKLKSMNRETQGREMLKLGAAPDWLLGSAHAVSEDGYIFVASNTGSQIAPYAYSAGHVVLVVGTQKIVKDWEEGKRRVYEYSLVKESERQKANGNPKGSNVSKLLVINKEIRPGRLTIIFVKEKLGF